MDTNERRSTRVAVALSGGVDSSTAAALLVQQGYQVVGLTMRLWATRHRGDLPDNRCCSSSAVSDARLVCEQLGIPFHLIDLEQEFKQHVVEYFCDSYTLGRTPNPCLACNRHIKFGALLDLAREFGVHCLATGHYARIREHNGRYQLLKGADPQKDQSYVLYMLGQNDLPYLVFPLGDHTKREVRAMAKQYGLPTAERDESQDACFVTDGDYRAFLAQSRPGTVRPGPILDLDGRVLGQHRGIAFYTIGQRQGLGIAAAHPLYVVKIDPLHNALVAGPKAAVFRTSLYAEDVHYVAGHPPQGTISVTAKIRYKAPEAPAALTPITDKRARVDFCEAQPAITPGQGVVFYRDEVVLGGGIITLPE